MWRTAQDFIALVDGEKPSLAGRAKYYRALAAVLVARTKFIQSAEARQELLVLACDYERLADMLEWNENERPESA